MIFDNEPAIRVLLGTYSPVYHLRPLGEFPRFHRGMRADERKALRLCGLFDAGSGPSSRHCRDGRQPEFRF
jgi:hypothetical protein